MTQSQVRPIKEHRQSPSPSIRTCLLSWGLDVWAGSHINGLTKANHCWCFPSWSKDNLAGYKFIWLSAFFCWFIHLFWKGQYKPYSGTHEKGNGSFILNNLWLTWWFWSKCDFSILFLSFSIWRYKWKLQAVTSFMDWHATILSLS